MMTGAVRSGYGRMSNGAERKERYYCGVCSTPIVVEGRHLKDKNNVAVIYPNPLDNVPVSPGREPLRGS